MSEAGDPGPLRIYFACVGNSGRSQLAEALCRELGSERVECASGGSDPLGRVLPDVITALHEVGIDTVGLHSKPIDERVVKACDLVVTMGCGEDACPAFHDVELEDWPLDDPKGADLATVRELRDDIALRMRKLLERHDALGDEGLPSP